MSRKMTTVAMGITFPNATHYAFTPAIVSIEHYTETLSNIKSYEVDIVVPLSAERATRYTESREVKDGRCVFDLSRYLQIALGNTHRLTEDYSNPFALSPLETYVGCEICATNRAGGSGLPVYEFGIDTLWGVGAPRESSGGVINRRWFKNFPFTVDVFAKKGTVLEVRTGWLDAADALMYDGRNSIGETPYNKLLFNPIYAWEAWGGSGVMRVTILDSIVLCDDIESIESITYALAIDDSTSGKYLRWVDSQGRICYYLFKELGTTYATGVASEWNRNTMSTPTKYDEGINIESAACRSFETKRTTSLGARLVDSETFDFLLSATRSPIIEVFDGFVGTIEHGNTRWHRVSVAAGNYPKTTKSLQDFTMTIEEPTRVSQIL